MEKINVSLLTGRVVIPYGIKIDIDGVIGIVSFRDEPRLGFNPSTRVIKGTNFEINPGDTQLQWEGDGITLEELWEKILEAWDDFQECMAFPSLILGGCCNPQ